MAKELLNEYRKLLTERNFIDERMDEIKGALLSDMKSDSEQVGDFKLSRVRTVSYKVGLPEARKFGAIKESVDQARLKELAASGVEIPNKTEKEFLRIKDNG